MALTSEQRVRSRYTGAPTLAIVPCSVQGIPALARVTRYTVIPGSYSRNAASDCDYYGYTEVEYELFDRRGYASPWLERKARDADRDNIEACIAEAMNEG